MLDEDANGSLPKKLMVLAKRAQFPKTNDSKGLCTDFLGRWQLKDFVFYPNLGEVFSS